MDIETLYTKVSEAIWRAEQMGDPNAPEAKAAFLEVSRLEEEIAKLLPVDNPEGMIARRGAVGAAISGGAEWRARALAERFSGEPGASDRLKRSLDDILRQGAGNRISGESHDLLGPIIIISLLGFGLAGLFHGAPFFFVAVVLAAIALYAINPTRR